MSEPSSDVLVDDSEVLVRYLFSGSGHIRDDGTMKPEALMPYKRVELSLTRSNKLTEDEIWNYGRVTRDEANVNRAAKGLSGVELVARSDLPCSAFTSQELRVIEKPLETNPFHVDAVDWPPLKHEQKVKALEIAKSVIQTIKAP